MDLESLNRSIVKLLALLPAGWSPSISRQTASVETKSANTPDPSSLLLFVLAEEPGPRTNKLRKS